MSITKRIAPLAIVLSLAGCGIAPGGVRQVPTTLGAPSGVFGSSLAGAQRTIAVLAAAEPTGMPAEPPMTMHKKMHKMKVHRIFEKLEQKHPAAKDELQRVEARLNKLTPEQHQALHKVVYDEIKNETIAEFHHRLKAMMKQPLELVAFLDRSIDRVEKTSQESAPISVPASTNAPQVTVPESAPSQQVAPVTSGH